MLCGRLAVSLFGVRNLAGVTTDELADWLAPGLILLLLGQKVPPYIAFHGGFQVSINLSTPETISNDSLHAYVLSPQMPF